MCLDVRKAGQGSKERPLALLQEAVHLHLLGEIAVAHPAVRNSGPAGDTVAVACQVEGEQLERALNDLEVSNPDFDASFEALSGALLDHASAQQRDEFPLLRRYVTTQRLHMMAGAMRDARIMAATD
ncbi:hypothetical protein GCM10010435_60740 [Winogradskya consettensis]|uniref:Hemerythrin-like domain-containing protein n=1 Tax=Winogradskya consettensis TaxID=113560 RepID=A0A919SPU9_9ACTN|nr:hypothetical protein Aco04nite_49820 [Actinoplanes consettensis]